MRKHGVKLGCMLALILVSLLALKFLRRSTIALILPLRQNRETGPQAIWQGPLTGAQNLPASLRANCSRMVLNDWDHTIGGAQPFYGLILHSAKVLTTQDGFDFSIPESCYASLQPELEWPDRIKLVHMQYNLTTHPDSSTDHNRNIGAHAEHHTHTHVNSHHQDSSDHTSKEAVPLLTRQRALSDSHPADRAPFAGLHLLGDKNLECVQAKGLWLILSEAAHGQDNLFEEGVSAWYPTYLMTHFALAMSWPEASSSVRITHVGGTKRGFLAFHEVYQLLGQYVPWQAVRGGSDSHATCVEFETAITLRTDWSWLNAPVMSHYNQALVSFGESLRVQLTHGNLKQPSNCRRKFLFAARTRSYRSILNKDDIMAAVRLLLKGFEVTMMDLSILPLSQQVQLVSQADIFMFEHGGAGTLVLMQSYGTVTLEVFPYGFADPMYRNMAIMTGKTYLAWQNNNISDARGNTEDRNTNTVVNIPSLMQLVASARDVSSNNIGDRFIRSNGEPYDRKLCSWCDEKQRTFVCGPNDP